MITYCHSRKTLLCLPPLSRQSGQLQAAGNLILQMTRATAKTALMAMSFVGTLPGVCAEVLGETALLGECLCTDVACVGTLPGVRAEVSGEVALDGESLCADVA